MSYDWKPGELAEYDQFLARANDNITLLAKSLKAMIELEGEPTAMAQITMALIEQAEPETLLGITTVALRRIALEGSGRPLP